MVLYLSAPICRSDAPVVRRKTIMVIMTVSLFTVSLLASAIGCRAEQGPPRTPGDTVPTLEALRSTTLPRGRFVQWCGDRIVMEVDRRYEIYDGEVKASPLSFPIRSDLICGDDNEMLIFVDEEDGRVSEVDIAKGMVTRTLANYDNTRSQRISFSPDLRRVASDYPIALVGASELKTLEFNTLGHLRWSRDSSALFGVRGRTGKANSSRVEIYSAQRQKIASGPLPAGFYFRNGWFADSQALYLYLASLRDEFGSGVVFRCPIASWKCVPIAKNVLEFSVGGGGTIGVIRALGKYSNDGEETTYPPGYVVEIRNATSQVLARQMFKPSERNDFILAIAPSGTRAVFTWHEFCPAEKRDSARCSNDGRGGIVIDLSGKPK
jgi:hypothetical protein